MHAIRLKTEYLVNPVGIEPGQPRLFWNSADGIRQTACQIVAADDRGQVLWDSGKVATTSMRMRWGGEEVPCRTNVIWKVRLWDQDNRCGDWKEARFETGLPEGEPWQADWITAGITIRKSRRYPVDCFRKDFPAGDIQKARLYITACGLYEARINGERAGDFILAPGITDYRKRVQYQVYDVTNLLRSGENRLEVQLADGWYRGSCGAWGRRNQYGTRTKLLVQLELYDRAGARETICSDESWRWSNDGPIRFADNKDGEMVDNRLQPTYAGRAKRASHPVIPSAANNVPVTEHERFTAALLRTPVGETVLDFGQNLAGYVSFKVKARDGQQIRLRFGETLDENGAFTQKNIQCTNKRITTPLQQAVLTCREGVNTYKTAFAIFGFRYVLVETDITVTAVDFTAIAVYSDLEQTGFFASSNALLDRFVANTVWSARSNTCDLPTDCPTRERHGWSGDAQVFCSTASYLFDFMPFARKYLRDLYDWQKENGCLPQIAPEGGTDFYMKAMNGSVGWADAGVLMPHLLWRQYGDTDILRMFRDGMRRYAGFMRRRCGKWYLTARRTGLKGELKKHLANAGQAYGEWAEPADVHPMSLQDFVVPHPEVATAYTALVMDCMAEIESALGDEAEAGLHRRFAAGCRRSYQALVETKAYSLDTDRQARLVRPLAFGLLRPEQAGYAKTRLLQALDRYGWRVGTGFLSTPLILDVLAEIDLDAAYRLLENEDMPGWLFMPKNGATTIWEAWEGNATPARGIASLNHYAKGGVCHWLFDTVCGIRVAGENRFRITPRPGGHLTFARADYTSVYGKVTSAWQRERSGTELTVTVPANCSAEVLLPDGTREVQIAGTRTYRVEYPHERR